MQVLTVPCKLLPSEEQHTALTSTAKAFADACQRANELAPPKLRSTRKIRNNAYYQIREEFDLPSSLADTVCTRVGANRKAAKGTDLSFRASSVDYNARTFSFRPDLGLASLSTPSGRLKVAVGMGDYQQRMLYGVSPSSAQLCLRGQDMYLNIQVKVETPEPNCSGDFLGVDLGRRDIATTSDWQSWEGKTIQRKRDKFSQVRASLQKAASEGTRSTRRRARQTLKRLRGRERRFQKWLNHNISKTIVEAASSTKRGIALEDLSGIRESINSKPRTKQERRCTNNWAFYQLRILTEYKAALAGVPVLSVPPAYTSQTCHGCLHIGSRKGKHFSCDNCGRQGDADVNAASTIARYGAAVNQPRGPGLNCSRAAESRDSNL